MFLAYDQADAGNDDGGLSGSIPGDCTSRIGTLMVAIEAPRVLGSEGDPNGSLNLITPELS